MKEAQENAIFYSPPKDLWPMKFTWKMSGMLVWFIGWGSTQKLSTSTNSHAKMCRPQWEYATLQWEYVDCPIFIDIYTYAKNSLKIRKCPNVKPSCECEHKGHFYINMKNISPLTLCASFVLIQSLHWSGNHWLESHLTWAPNTTKTWPLAKLAYLMYVIFGEKLVFNKV